MKTTTMRTIIDLLMYAAMSFLTGTGLLIYYRLVPGSQGGHGLTFLGLSRHEWGTYHLWAAYLVLMLVVVHLILNYAFIKNVIAAKKNWLIIVLGGLGVAVTLFFLLAPLERTPESSQRQNQRLRSSSH